MGVPQSVGVGVEEGRDLLGPLAQEVRGGEPELGVERRAPFLVRGGRQEEAVDDAEVHGVHTVLVDRLDTGPDGERGDPGNRPPVEVEIGDVEGGTAAGRIVPREQEAEPFDGRVDREPDRIGRVSRVLRADTGSRRCPTADCGRGSGCSRPPPCRPAPGSPRGGGSRRTRPRAVLTRSGRPRPARRGRSAPPGSRARPRRPRPP